MDDCRELAIKFKETGCNSAFSKLYKQLKPGLICYVRGMVSDPDAVNEIVSITFAKAYSKIDQYNPFYQVSTWIYRIARNESLQHNMRENSRVSLDTSNSSLEVDCDGNLSNNVLNPSFIEWETSLKTHGDESERYVLAINEIENLKNPYRDVLIDRIIHDLTYEEIAAKHSISLQCVKNRIHRARLQICEILSKKRPKLFTGYKRFVE
jgi:RNA polymerase sigma-70 factor (ECF subfamily)